jgi:hypothetical protein
MSGYWKNSYPDALHSFKDFDVSPIHNEIAVLAKEAGFQDVGEDDTAELLESHSLPLMNEEPADMDKQTYKEAQNDDDNNVISEEKTLTIKGLREAFSKIDEAVDYSRNHDSLYDCYAKVKREVRDMLLSNKANQSRYNSESENDW